MHTLNIQLTFCVIIIFISPESGGQGKQSDQEHIGIAQHNLNDENSSFNKAH